MRNTAFTFLIVGMILVACAKENDTGSTKKPVSTSINKIMPLGASRVEGARPEYESFRYELWKDLVDGGYTFDFIGQQSDDGSYSAYKSKNFDRDHEGYGGATSQDLRNGIDGILQNDIPDLVLFSSPGGNNALEGLSYNQAVANINAIIDALQTANPKVTILIEQMAPGKSSFMTSELKDYLERIQSEVLQIASTQSTSQSKVIAVDMFTGFNDAFLADDIHYNQAGAQFVAERYYHVLSQELE